MIALQSFCYSLYSGALGKLKRPLLQCSATQLQAESKWELNTSSTVQSGAHARLNDFTSLHRTVDVPGSSALVSSTSINFGNEVNSPFLWEEKQTMHTSALMCHLLFVLYHEAPFLYLKFQLNLISTSLLRYQWLALASRALIPKFARFPLPHLERLLLPTFCVGPPASQFLLPFLHAPEEGKVVAHCELPLLAKVVLA